MRKLSVKLLGFSLPMALVSLGMPFSAMATSDSHHVDNVEMHLRHAINCNNGMMKNTWSNINWDSDAHGPGHASMHHNHYGVQWAMRVEVYRNGVQVHYHGSGWVNGNPMGNYFVPDIPTYGGQMKIISYGWRKENNQIVSYGQITSYCQ